MIAPEPSGHPATIRGVQHNPNPPESPETAFAVSPSIDWLDLSGPHNQLVQARQIFTDLFPSPEELPNGNGYYANVLVHPQTDSTFSWDAHSGHEKWHVQLKGQGCGSFEDPETLLSALSSLDPSEHTSSRIDLAVDLYGPLHNLISDLKKSHDHQHIHPRVSCLPALGRGPSGNVIQDQITFGSYKSDKHLCVYDKGLEQKTNARGEWIRWEHRCRNRISTAVYQSLRSNPSSSHVRDLAAGYFQSVGSEGMEWFDLVSTSPLSVVTSRAPSTIEKRLVHMRKATGVLVEASQLSGIDPYELARGLDLFPTETQLSRNPSRTGLARIIIEHHLQNSDTLHHMPSILDQDEN